MPPPDSMCPDGENPEFLTTQLITYLGNKRSLLPMIGEAVGMVQRRLGRSKLSLVDLFSGTGVVARYLKQFAAKLYVNDLEGYSEVTNRCYLANRSNINGAELRQALEELRQLIRGHFEPGFITEMYAARQEDNIQADDRVFYTRRNAIYLDSARTQLEKIAEPLRIYLLAPLLARASVHANTSGVFKGFYKNKDGTGQFGGHGQDALRRILGEIEVELPCLSNFECESQVFRQDANALVRSLPEVDLAYLDPPYNQHPYGSNYFMLNLLVDYERPAATSRVSGIPTGWNRSRYNQRQQAQDALFDLIAHCPARWVLISYNSEGFIPQTAFLQRLADHGHYQVCETRYNAFRGSRNLRARPLHVKEYLYLLEKS